MNRPSKKTSAKIIVDEYERFCQGHKLPKKGRISEHLKEDHYHKYIDQEFI